MSRYRPAVLRAGAPCLFLSIILLSGCGVAEFLGFGRSESPKKKHHKEIPITRSYLREPDTDIIPTRRTKPSADFRAVRVQRSSVTDLQKRREVFEILAWARLCGVPAHPSSQLPSVTRYDLSDEKKRIATIWAYELEGTGGFKYWVKTQKGGYVEYDPGSPKPKAARPAKIKAGRVLRTDYAHIEHHGEAFEYIANANLAYNCGEEGGFVPGNLGDGVQIYLKEQLYGTVWIERDTVYFKAPDGRVFVYRMKTYDQGTEEDQ